MTAKDRAVEMQRRKAPRFHAESMGHAREFSESCE
jgi:hypothetical protein